MDKFSFILKLLILIIIISIMFFASHTIKERNNMKVKSIAMLVVSALTLSHAHAKNYDLATDNSLPFNQIDERYFVTNSNSSTANITVNNDFIINHNGSFHLGFAGKTDSLPGSLAAGAINMTINGNMHVYNDTWIGKFDTQKFTELLGLHKDFPFSPTEQDIDVHVTGDINVALGADKKRGGLMILAGNVMGGNAAITGKTTVKVDGDVNIRSGDNHLAGTSSSPAKLITRTFNLTGGDIEIIGIGTVLKTTNTDNNRSSVFIGNDGNMIIMRGGTVDVSNGGNLDVADEGVLTASRGNGFVKLATDGQVNIGSNARIESSKGSLTISDQSSQSSKLNVAGTINFGVDDAGRMNKIAGDNVSVKSSARFLVSNDFIKKALSMNTADANAIVLEGNQSLNIDGMTVGETRSLVKNIYGDFNFKLSGKELAFVNVSNATNFNDENEAKAAANRQLKHYYQQAGINSHNIAKGLAGNLVKVADSALNNTRTASSDKSLAGNMNWDVLETIAKGAKSGKYHVYFNPAVAGLYNNNRGLHITEIALNSFNQTKVIIDNRLDQFYQTSNSVNNGNSVWINLTHQYEDNDSKRGIAGYKYSANGFLLGYDKSIQDDWLIGAAFGYSDGNYKDKSAVSNDSDIKNYQVQLYSRYKLSNDIFTTAYFGYTYGDIELKQHDGAYLAKEDFLSHTWNVGGNLGYSWHALPSLTLTPSVGLTYVYTENSAHNVKYNQAKLIKYGTASNSALFIPMDITADYSVLQHADIDLSVKAKVGYAFNLTDDEFDNDITINGINGLNKMSARTSGRSKNQFNMGTGIALKFNQFDFDIDYHYFGENKRDAHYLSAMAKYQF